MISIYPMKRSWISPCTLSPLSFSYLLIQTSSNVWTVSGLHGSLCPLWNASDSFCAETEIIEHKCVPVYGVLSLYQLDAFIIWDVNIVCQVRLNETLNRRIVLYLAVNFAKFEKTFWMVHPFKGVKFKSLA